MFVSQGYRGARETSEDFLSDGSLEDLLLFADQPHPLRNKVLPIEIDAETPAKVYESEEIDDALTSVTERTWAGIRSRNSKGLMNYYNSSQIHIPRKLEPV